MPLLSARNVREKKTEHSKSGVILSKIEAFKIVLLLCELFLFRLRKKMAAKRASFLLLLVVFETIKSEEMALIASDETADFGEWSEFMYCPRGSFAYAFRSQIDYGDIEWGDKSALNGVELKCSDSARSILTFQGEYGAFAAGFSSCARNSNSQSIERQHFLVGFKVKMKIVNVSDYDGDDSAVNALQMKCGDTFLTSNEQVFGEWKPELDCPNDSAICGFRAKYDYEGVFKSAGYAQRLDYTGLNRVEFVCCPLV